MYFKVYGSGFCDPGLAAGLTFLTSAVAGPGYNLAPFWLEGAFSGLRVRRELSEALRREARSAHQNRSVPALRGADPALRIRPGPIGGFLAYATSAFSEWPQ